jgi:hypothetical protein
MMDMGYGVSFVGWALVVGLYKSFFSLFFCFWAFDSGMK